MNTKSDLFLQRVRLPREALNRLHQSREHLPSSDISFVDLFRLDAAAADSEQHTAAATGQFTSATNQELFSGLDELAAQGATFEGILAENTSQQHQGEVPMKLEDQKETDYTKPMSADETRAAVQHAAPTLGGATQAAAVMPPRRGLGALVQAHKRAGDQLASEGEGKGGRQGGQERPSHSSYYSPVPVGGIAMPKRGSTIGDAVVQRDQAQRKRRSQTI